MHIPDGFLSFLVSIVFWVISVILIGIALKKTNQELKEREVPLMGVLAAAIFAAQMLNFSITGGTSGHFLGAAIMVILIGPWPAILVMTSVVSVQALLFQDGGVLVLGANIFNMAIVGVFVAYAVYSFVSKLFQRKSWGIFVAGFAAAWSSIFIASLSCALQVALSGTSPANIAIPAMGTIHALIGIAEGLITTGALAFLFAARKDLLGISKAKSEGNTGVFVGGGLIALVLVVISPLASSHPDGLEWVAGRYGFIETARESIFKIIPNYHLSGISNPALATIAAGIVGIVVVFGVAYGVACADKRPTPQENDRR
ncbi:MAG: energy-coupling factor ABC transporter permease [Chloroflexi bacterium]|nr:energy-coupling factor ABC transporter permease [Chloroflexota bacterium]